MDFTMSLDSTTLRRLYDESTSSLRQKYNVFDSTSLQWLYIDSTMTLVILQWIYTMTKKLGGVDRKFEIRKTEKVRKSLKNWKTENESTQNKLCELIVK